MVDVVVLAVRDEQFVSKVPVSSCRLEVVVFAIIYRNKKRVPEITNVDIRGKFDAKSLAFELVVHFAFHVLELEGKVNIMVQTNGI